MYSFNRTPAYAGDRELPGLQILKFICAIMVVQIHTFSALGMYVMPLCRIAVPVFFMISGYFMVNKEGRVSSYKISRSAVKIVKIMLYVLAAYMLYDVMINIVIDRSLGRFTYPSFWVYELLFGSGIREHLWYLTAYVQTLILIYVLLKAKSFPLIFILLPIGIAVNLLVGCYGFLIFDSNNPLIYSRNVLTMAIPCVLIGVLIRVYESYLPSAKIIACSLLAAIVALYAECVIVQHSRGDVVAMTIPVAVLTFILFLRFETQNMYLGVIGQRGKKHSLDIYLWHPMVAGVFYFIQGRLGIYTGMNTLIVAALTLALSIAVTPSTLPARCYAYLKRRSSRIFD